MTAFRCPEGHSVLVEMDADAAGWRCPVHGWKDVDEARRFLEEAGEAGPGALREDPRTEAG
jgi:hypothetical protein